MSTTWNAKGVNSYQWARIRKFVLDRDNWQCMLRVDSQCAGKANTVHHKLGKGVTPDWNTDAQCAACAHCNFVVGQPAQSTAYTGLTKW